MSQSFGAEVDAYDRARPDYPRDAVHWLLGDAHRVADVGAGTGKLSAVIAELGREVIAIEPDDAMRSMCRRRLPDIEVFDGSGEHLPLPDSSVDAVTFGQAWHWVDPQLACAEAARVLRPDGVLALMWNVRDQTVDWVDQLTTVANAQNGEGLALVNPPAFTAPFQRAENQRWSWTRDITPAGTRRSDGVPHFRDHRRQPNTRRDHQRCTTPSSNAPRHCRSPGASAPLRHHCVEAPTMNDHRH